MKILQLIYESSGSPFGFGGAGMRAYEIYRRLKGRHEIVLLSMKYPGATDGEIGGINHVFLGTESGSLTKSVLSYTIKTAHFIKKNGRYFDIVIENFLPSTPFFTKYLTKTRVVLQIQDYWGPHVFKRYPLRFALPMFLFEKYYPRLYKKVIFVSDVTRKRFQPHHREGQVIIPNGIDGALLETKREEKNYILFMSSIDIYKKGLDLLLRAFAEVSSSFEGLNLYIAGTGRDSEVLKGEIVRLPLITRERIKILGWVSGSQKREILSGALFTLLPSRHESQPISILESGATGTPVIVSDIPEHAFVQEEHAGTVFESGNEKDLALKMKELLSDGNMRNILSDNGRNYAKQFLWEKTALQFEEHLKELCRLSV